MELHLAAVSRNLNNNYCIFNNHAVNNSNNKVLGIKEAVILVRTGGKNRVGMEVVLWQGATKKEKVLQHKCVIFGTRKKDKRWI